MTDPLVDIHDTAARGFTAGADAYERSRPDYPAAAVAEIVERLDLRPGRTIVDLGAGTGKLTRLLVPSGARIIAVEPLDAMRAKLAMTAPSADAIAGTAEAIPLPDGSVDGVTCGQAFHWFDARRAFAELHRVVRPEGMLALVWNVRDESVPWVKAMGDIVQELIGGEPRHQTELWLPEARRTPYFDYLGVTRTPHAQRLTPDGVVDRLASISVVAAAPPDRRAATEERVRAVLRSDPLTAGRDEVELPYSTKLHWLRRLPADPATGVG